MFNFFKNKKSAIEDEVVTISENFENIELISQYFYNETGINFKKQITILKNKTTLFCRQHKIYSFEELLSKIELSKNLKQELVDYLTTNETYFYREVKQIEELVKLVKKENKKVDILCAPSATGEEPYSIAIALLEARVDKNHFRIVGIDINSSTIQKAKDGVYLERNIRNLSTTIIKKYFIKNGLEYTICDDIKPLVSFHVLNIFDSSFTTIGKFDFVLSRNMLIYFDKETKNRAKAILQSMRKNNKHEVFFGHADLF